jgi:hypothetical protein
MTLDNLVDYPLNSLEPIHGRELLTVSYLLKHHGYAFLADEVKELAEQILQKGKNERTNSSSC